MNKPTLIIGNKNYSSWSLRPWILMKEKKIAFNEKRIALFTDTMQAELSTYQSDSKVPVLQEGELTIWDSLAILEYLSETYLDGNGYPSDKNARALARAMSCEMHSSFSAVRNELPMNCRKQFTHIKPSVKAQHEIKRIEWLWEQAQKHSNGPWLFGDYGIVDAMFAPIALRFYGYAIELGNNAQNYVASVLKQPAIIDWMAAATIEQEVISIAEVQVQ